MAYFSKLPSDKQHAYYELIQKKVSSEAESMYRAALAQAKTKKQKDACAGQYKGVWFSLLEDWMSNKVTNLFVADCLALNFVPDY